MVVVVGCLALVGFNDRKGCVQGGVGALSSVIIGSCDRLYIITSTALPRELMRTHQVYRVYNIS
jgi:hypothetical protein